MAVHDLSLYLKSDRSSFNLLVHVVSEAELSPKDIVARNTIISIIMIIDTKVTTVTKNVISAVVSSSRFFLFRHLFITWLSRLDVRIKFLTARDVHFLLP